MNEISVSNSTLSSLEVAEMVEKTHANLLKDIRRYSQQLAEVKIDFSDFWSESTYKSDNNTKQYTCYLVTKKGCEFIAHKMTGAKGTVFTARYINRFHEMEEAIHTAQGTTTARKLYKFLELEPKNYSRWCKSNIVDNEFAEENFDYWAFVVNDER